MQKHFLTETTMFDCSLQKILRGYKVVGLLWHYPYVTEWDMGLGESSKVVIDSITSV